MQPTLFDLSDLVPTVQAPEFSGMTFHETRAKTMLNRMRDAPAGGIAWTLNPYRGCSHACTYCFARDGHARLGMDVGGGFNSQIIVKTNAAEVLSAELRRGRARGDWVMMGTVTDCYQRAEGRYRLMPAIVDALGEYRISFTTATKSALLGRDIDRFARAAERANVLVMVSLGSLDDRVRRAFEPAAAPPRARLDLVQARNTLPENIFRGLASDYGQRRSMSAEYVRRVTEHVEARATGHGLPTWMEYIRAFDIREYRAGEQLSLGPRSLRD